MMKGWKTRMDERIYFEEKREERETKSAFMKVMRIKLIQEIEEMKRESGVKYETH